MDYHVNHNHTQSMAAATVVQWWCSDDVGIVVLNGLVHYTHINMHVRHHACTWVHEVEAAVHIPNSKLWFSFFHIDTDVGTGDGADTDTDACAGADTDADTGADTGAGCWESATDNN